MASSNNTKLQQLEKDHKVLRTAWEAEKDRLMERQKELEINLHLGKKQIEQLKKANEDQKRAWEVEKERLLKTQKDLETKLNLDKLRYKTDPVLVQTIRTKAAEEEKKAINGLTILDKELFVVSNESSEVEVYDSIKFSFSRRWEMKELADPWDIVSCSTNKCLYINDYKLCGHLGQLREILRIDPNGKCINKWSTGDDWGWGMSVTDKSNIILTVYEKHKLNEYSPDGQLVREVIISSDTGIRHPRHAIKLSNGQFVVSHGSLRTDDLHRVCVVDANGKLMKSFGGICGSSIGQINRPFHLSIDGNGFAMVADEMNHRVLLLDPEMGFKRAILLNEEMHGLRYPYRILLDESNVRVFVVNNGFDSEKKIFVDGRISISDY